MVTFASLIERARRTPPWVADTVLAGTIFAIGVVELVFFARRTLLPQEPFRLALVWSIPAFAGMSLPLAMRRRNLWVSYLLIETAAVVAGQTHLAVSYGLGSLLVFTVLLYTVGEQSSGPVTAALTLGQWGYFYSLEFEATNHDAAATLLRNDLVFYLPLLGFPAFAGWAQRRRRRLTAELETRAAEVQRERELLADQAVARERVRIAQELRGLVIRGVDRMTRIATSARRDVGEAPDRARSEIADLETTGRGTLVEMRRLLGVLRRADQAADLGTTDGEKVTSLTDRSLSPAIQRGSPGLVSRLRHLPGRGLLIDAAVAGVIAGLALLEFAPAGPTDEILGGWLPRALMAIIVLAVLLRRAAPFTVLTVIASCEFLWILLRGNTPGSADRALLIAVYTVAAHKGIGWAAAAVGMGIFAWGPLPATSRCICLVDIGAQSIFAVIAGHSILEGRMVNRELQEQTDLLQRTRQERVRVAVAEERTRVAREMHDVVAHAVTGMVVQAGGARLVAVDEPGLADTTLQDIQQIGREALEELRGLVQTLDPPGPPTRDEFREDAPDVGSLIERARRAGQDVVFDQEGEAQEDQGIQISLYRIVQEALTNARRHAPGAPATVTVRHMPRVVEVEVRNGAPSGLSDPAILPGTGHGLIGIGERAAVFGGTAEAGPTSDGGFRVYARFPRDLALV